MHQETPTADALLERVIAAVAAARQLPPEAIPPDASFKDLGMDSLDAMTLLFELETTFEISLPDEQAAGSPTCASSPNSWRQSSVVGSR